MPTYLLPIITAVAGLFLGWFVARLAVAAKLATIAERLRSEERHAADLDARLAAATAASAGHERDALAVRDQLTDLRSRREAEQQAAAEKHALLERAEAKLADTFKALSADALRSSSEQFLQLAKSSLTSHNEEARGDLEKRKVAIETLVKPVAESLGKFELRIGEIEKSREGAYAELREQVRALGEGQLGLQRETSSRVLSEVRVPNSITSTREISRPLGEGRRSQVSLAERSSWEGASRGCCGSASISPISLAFAIG